MDDTRYEQAYWRKRNRGGRRFPCPTCHEENAITAHEKAQGYQCDRCADRDEGLTCW